MLSVLVHRSDVTTATDRVDPQWLDPSSATMFWADLTSPSPDESRLLTDVFRFHPLSVEDAISEIQYPKIESYDSYLYLVLHGVAISEPGEEVATREVDFFVGANYIVTVHVGQSRSIDEQGHHRLQGAGEVAKQTRDAALAARP